MSVDVVYHSDLSRCFTPRRSFPVSFFPGDLAGFTGPNAGA